MAYELIETIELGTSAASITFSAISQDFTDLLILVSARNAAGTNWNNMRMSFNGSSTNYSEIFLAGLGSSVQTVSGSAAYLEFMFSNGISTSDTFGNGSIYISNYTASQAKSVSLDTVTENNATAAIQTITAGLWNNTSAITSITIDGQANGGSFTANSTFSLYGIS